MASRQVLWSKIREYMEQLNLWCDSLQADLPIKWEHHGECVIFPSTTFKSPVWFDSESGKEGLYQLICDTMKVKKIARKTGGIVCGDSFRSPQVELLYGSNGWTDKTENGIKYTWDVTKLMFCSGNISEKQRIASWDLSESTVVDLYAGMGYFTLNYLVHAKAKLLYACEWNPAAIESLNINLRNNKVEDKCVVLEGDNIIKCPQNVADHVNLGLIPTSEPSWEVACKALKKSTGGILHVSKEFFSGKCLQIHGNVDLKHNGTKTNDHNLLLQTSQEYENMVLKKYPLAWVKWAIQVCERIKEIIQSLYIEEEWTVEIVEVVRVKSYGPCVDHLVADLSVRPDVT